MLARRWTSQYRPLFLHFLAAEVPELAGYRPTPRETYGALATLALCTASPLHVAVSSLWEHPGIGSATIGIASQLVAADQLHTIGYEPLGPGFLERRRQLYAHDRGRYPSYFEGKFRRSLLAIPTTLLKSDDTTATLEASLVGWSHGVGEPVGTHPTQAQLDVDLRAVVRDAIQHRGEEALTYAYFRSFIDNSPLPSGAAERLLRMRLYGEYLDDYREAQDADIATGVSGLLDAYDLRIAKNYPAHDVKVLRFILKAIGLEAVVSAPWSVGRRYWDALADERGHGAHRRLTELIAGVVQASATYCVQELGLVSHEIRSGAMRVLGPHLEDLPSADANPNFVLEEASHQLELAVRRMARKDHLGLQILAATQDLAAMRADIVLVAATQVEADAVLEVFAPHYRGPLRRVFDDRNVYFDLGRPGGARTVLVQSQMGSGGPGAAHDTAVEALNTFSPSAVCMVGIAFGAPAAGRSIGDVLVSRRLMPYELARVGTTAQGKLKLVPRAPQPPASDALIKRFEAGVHDWIGPPVLFGLLLSGEKLIDNVDYRDDIMSLSGSEAIGGEMEGGGLYAAAAGRKTNWIIVKAICDWADGRKHVKKGERQRLAAINAAHFVEHVLTRGGFRSE